MRTGQGQQVHAALSRSGTFLQIPFMIDYERQAWNEPRGQDAKGWGPLYCLYKARDKWFFIAAHRDGDLDRLATVAGLETITETAIADLGAHLESRFESASAEDWIARIRSVGLSAHVLVNYQESMESPIVKRRGLSIVRNHPEIGDVRNVGSPAKISRTPLVSLFRAPPLGRHAREILGEVGYGDRLEECVNTGVVGGANGKLTNSPDKEGVR